MGSAGNALISGIDPATIVAAFDGLYAYELTVVSWAIVVRSQLEGPAAYLLGEELDELVERSLGHARSLAERAAQLGGSLTADPTGFVARSPVDAFGLPASTSDPSAVLGYALGPLQRAIRAYGALLAEVAGRDEITHHLLLHILRDHVDLEDEIESALAGQPAVPAATA
jgi:ferritin-like protein